MKITFYASKETFEILLKRLEKGIRGGEYTLAVRDHKQQSGSTHVVTMTNRYEGIIPEFQQTLKSLEYKKQITHLHIEPHS